MVNDTTVIYRRSRQPAHTHPHLSLYAMLDIVHTPSDGMRRHPGGRKEDGFRFMTTIDDWRSAPSLCHTVLTTSRGRIPVTTGRCTYYRTDVK